MFDLIVKLNAMVKEIIRSQALIVTYSKFENGDVVVVNDKIDFTKEGFNKSFNATKPQYISVLLNEEGVKHIKSLIDHKVDMTIRNENEIKETAVPFLNLRVNWIKSEF